MTLIAIDIGTTHCKAGLFNEDGVAVRIANRPMITHQSPEGWAYYDPLQVLEIVKTILYEITLDQQEPIAAIGIASMAETGLLVERDSGNPSSPLLPWFETSSQTSADLILERCSSLECYLKFGLKVNFKSSLAKILWLSQDKGWSLTNKLWLSAADFVAYYLTGNYGTDYSLASRTLAFRLDRKEWDSEWLLNWGIPEDIFPPAYPSGKPIGKLSRDFSGIKAGTAVSICGHDHVCAALAMGAITPGIVFDSMGTAETLIGMLPERLLTKDDYLLGLQCGCHVAQGLGYWMGGNSTSGGSLEWMRGVVSPIPLSYIELENLIDLANSGPTGILYYPYLLGSGSPHTNSRTRAAFIGITMSHKSEDIFKAVLEGVAYEMEFIRRSGEKMSGQAIRSLVAAGGGSRYLAWMQIKADISGCEIIAPTQPEATLLGAALAAGIGCGLYRDATEALARLAPQKVDTFYPDAENHAIYKRLFDQGYLMFQEPLRNYSQSFNNFQE
jgi:sugar (pentulose or hexulose) kinase